MHWLAISCRALATGSTMQGCKAPGQALSIGATLLVQWLHMYMTRSATVPVKIDLWIDGAHTLRFCPRWPHLYPAGLPQPRVPQCSGPSNGLGGA